MERPKKKGKFLTCGVQKVCHPYHRIYNVQSTYFYLFGYIISDFLKEIQEETYIKIKSVFKGRFNQMALAEKHLLDHTINKCNKYLNHQNITKYLSSI